MGTDAATVLVVDPDAESQQRLAVILRRDQHRAVTCATGARALELLNDEPADVLVTELALPDMTALDLLAGVEERWPGLPVVVIAEGASATEAVGALKAGAADFVEKPFDVEQISYVVGKALTSVKNRALRPPPPPSSARAGMLGESAAMKQAYATLQRAAQSNATVLVRGESGTGKELVARAIHDTSPRASQPFVKIDCTALPENLLDSELFGYEKGAFTGAVSRKPGRVELADKGTLFLDEIGELSLPLQAKLLRLLQERRFERLGGTKTIQVDVRIVAATHRDLENMIERQQFRLDLFYRLNVVPLWLPPLRARREDIELLATHFCKTFARSNGKPEVRIDPGALRALRSQRWPGNVRQLQNFIERLVVLAGSPVISEQDIKNELGQTTFKTQEGTAEAFLRARGEEDPSSAPTRVGSVAADLRFRGDAFLKTEHAATVALPTPSGSGGEAGEPIKTLDDEMKAAEKRALERALAHCQGNRSLAARLLGVSRSTLYTKLKEHGLLTGD